MRYHEAAEVELLGKVGYLEERAAGLGRRFLEEVRRVERLIEQFPEAGPEIRAGIRKRSLRKFRYALIYAVGEQEPLILAVAHHSRRPGYWLGRAGAGEEQRQGGV